MVHENGHNGEAFDGLIDAFYDIATAATQDCAWCTVLPKLCHAFEASAGSFMGHDFSARQGALRHDFNIRPQFRDAYNDGLSAMNPWMDSLAFYAEGAVVFGEDIVSSRDIVRTEFYRSYLEPQALLHHLCGVIAQDGTDAQFISLLRPPEAAAFDEQDKAALSRLLPHLRRSIKVRDEIVRDRLARESLSELMDRLPVAFLLVGSNAHVALKNRVAREMIARGDGLFVGAGGYLATAFAKHTTHLRQLIAMVADAAPDGEDPDAGQNFVIPRGFDRLPLIGVAYPVHRSCLASERVSDPAVALLVKDPEIERLDGLSDYASAYALTNAETRLIGLLTQGHGLFEAAHELGITKNTARTHMRNIYAKIGIRRQTHLIRLSAQFSMF